MKGQRGKEGNRGGREPGGELPDLGAELRVEGRAMGRHSRRGFMWEAGHWIPQKRRPNHYRRRVV